MFIAVTVLRNIVDDGPEVPIKTFINTDTIWSIDEEDGKMIIFYKDKDADGDYIREKTDATLIDMKSKLEKAGVLKM